MINYAVHIYNQFFYQFSSSRLMTKRFFPGWQTNMFTYFGATKYSYIFYLVNHIVDSFVWIKSGFRLSKLEVSKIKMLYSLSF